MKNLMRIVFLKVLYSITGSSFLDYLFLKMKMKTEPYSVKKVFFLKKIHILAVTLSTDDVRYPGVFRTFI